MNKQFVTYEIALKLKELGFDEKCLASYYTDDERNYAKDGTYDCRQKISSSIDFDPFKEEFDNFYINSNETYYVSAPLWQQVTDWFREKHSIFVFIDMGKYYDSYEGAYPFQAWCKIYKNKELINSITVRNKLDNENLIFYSYEEAREQAILKALELILNKTHNE